MDVTLTADRLIPGDEIRSMGDVETVVRVVRDDTDPERPYRVHTRYRCSVRDVRDYDAVWHARGTDTFRVARLAGV